MEREEVTRDPHYVGVCGGGGKEDVISKPHNVGVTSRKHTALIQS